MRDIHGIGFDDFTNGPFAPKSPDARLIKKFENHFQVRLLSFYLDVLKQFNGRAPSLSVFRMISSSGEVGVSSLSSLFHLVEDQGDSYGVWYNTKFLRDIIQDECHECMEQAQNLVAIGEDGGGAIIFLDLSENREDVKILYRQSGGSILHIANTFEEFIYGLQETDNPE